MNPPNPAMVAEPTSNTGGYAYTGDSTTAEILIAPKIAAVKTAITRLSNSRAPYLLPLIVQYLVAKTRELQSGQIVAGDGTGQNVTGIYDTANVGSQTVTGAPQITAPFVLAGLDASFQYPASEKRIIMHPDGRAVVRGLAFPTAVAKFYMDDMVMGTPVLVTHHLDNAKPGRTVIGPMREVYVKEWDNAVYVSRREEDGQDILTVELFWNMAIIHPSLFHRLHQA